MSTRLTRRPRRSPALLVPLVALLASSPGCGGRFARSARPSSPEGTTIGRDMRAEPAGSVLPATSLGVDLVGSPSPSDPHRDGRKGARDAALAQAAYSPAGSIVGDDD